MVVPKTWRQELAKFKDFVVVIAHVVSFLYIFGDGVVLGFDMPKGWVVALLLLSVYIYFGTDKEQKEYAVEYVPGKDEESEGDMNG